MTGLARPAAYLITLLWLNLYICREMFTTYSPKMNSMQGFWISMARLGGGDWFHSQWWRYWDCGIPMEFVYAPLVPTLSAWTAAIRGVPADRGFQTVSGIIYCLLPVTLFLMAWLLTAKPGFAFAAALLYSLASPSQLFVPDGKFSLPNLFEARSFYLAAVWDETPHLTALALLPLVILFLALSILKRKPLYYTAAALTIAAASLASDFGPVLTVMASVCLLFVLRRDQWLQNIFLTAGIGLFAYAICCPFLSPANIQAIRTASAYGAGRPWNLGSFTALAITATGWALLWHYLPRWTSDWRLQFFALFAWLTSSLPITYMYLNRTFLPQPGRYAVEMEVSLSLLLAFVARSLLAKLPCSLRVCLLLLLVAFAAEEVVAHRKFAKATLAPTDTTQTIEYRTSLWVRDHLPGVRVMLPGSIGKWANVFTDIEQFSSGSWSTAYNQVLQYANEGVYHGADSEDQDARVSLIWLKAYGAGAIAVSGPQSQEFWKAFTHPNKFNSRLPVLWSADDVTIYRVPLPSDSFAHVLPAAALVRRKPSSPRDIAETEKYVNVLDDPSLAKASFQWESRNRIHIRTTAAAGQALSVQVAHHPGWHASVNGVSRPVRADGLGLMWLAPECNGACDVLLEYNGGAELIVCHAVSLLAWASLAIFLGLAAKRTLKLHHTPQ